MIHYEFPINERIRTLLRLEALYTRTDFFMVRAEPHDHHIALLGMFEIMEVASRADLKSDLLQELERQRQALVSLKNNPQISEAALEQVLTEIENAHAQLIATTGKFGQHLRENEWLMAIKQRLSIPGGVCEFDLPSYHYWLSQSVEARRQELDNWIAPLRPIQHAGAIVLRLLRDSAKTHNYSAKMGCFQQMSGGKTIQMLRISLDKELTVVPELSANRYAINIRFVQPTTNGDRAKCVETEIPFALSYCNL